jgi:ferrous iron transport protein B
MAGQPITASRTAAGVRAAVAGERPLVLVGNPNVGKSLLFGLLTRTYVAVSNYPGTTVEVSRARLRRSGAGSELIDTPGINTLLPTSEDEKVTRDILLRGGDVLQVGDARNLRRALLLTAELAEMGAPLVLCLNMGDEAARAGVRIDLAELERALGVPCVETVAVRREGLRELAAALERPAPSGWRVAYPPEVEEAASEIADLLPPAAVSRRSLALMLLAGDETLAAWLHRSVPAAIVERIRAARERTSAAFAVPLRSLMQRARLRAVDEVVARAQRNGARRAAAAGRLLDRATMHPLLGPSILAVVLALVFGLVGWLGAGVAVDLLETRLFEGLVNPAARRAFEALVPWATLRDLFVGPYGIVTMGLTYALAIVLPVVVTFFLAFGVLEDSGYLPRLAVIVNRLFRAMGLNGKAVLPMVLGLGCDTMATLTTRILETRKERVIVTLLLALAVPCSAQLGVLLGLLAGLSWAAAAVWAGVVAGTLLLVGWLAARVLPGRGSDFILEIPPLRWPRPANLLAKTLGRVEWYLKEAVPLFVAGTVVLFVADRIGAIAAAERLGRPLVVGLLGLPAGATEVFLMGFLRRDFGAAGLFRMSQEGALDPIQTVVSIVVITLFIPCVANFFMMIKERGLWTAAAIAAFVFPFALAVGAAVNVALRAAGFPP